MMRWQRSNRRQFCGKCEAEIQIGDPVLVIAIADLSGVKIRCAACEAAPLNLPPMAADYFSALPLRLPLMMQRALDLADYKARQTKGDD